MICLMHAVVTQADACLPADQAAVNAYGGMVHLQAVGSSETGIGVAEAAHALGHCPEYVTGFPLRNRLAELALLPYMDACVVLVWKCVRLGCP